MHNRQKEEEKVEVKPRNREESANMPTTSDKNDLQHDPDPIQRPPPDSTVDLADVFEALKNDRRRYLIRYFNTFNDTDVPLSDLAEQIAAWENGKALHEVTSKERKSVYVALYQNHLKRLDEWGFVNYNEDDGTITATDDFSILNDQIQTKPTPPKQDTPESPAPDHSNTDSHTGDNPSTPFSSVTGETNCGEEPVTSSDPSASVANEKEALDTGGDESNNSEIGIPKEDSVGDTSTVLAKGFPLVFSLILAIAATLAAVNAPIHNGLLAILLGIAAIVCGYPTVTTQTNDENENEEK